MCLHFLNTVGLFVQLSYKYNWFNFLCGCKVNLHKHWFQQVLVTVFLSTSVTQLPFLSLLQNTVCIQFCVQQYSNFHSERPQKRLCESRRVSILLKVLKPSHCLSLIHIKIQQIPLTQYTMLLKIKVYLYFTIQNISECSFGRESLLTFSVQAFAASIMLCFAFLCLRLRNPILNRSLAVLMRRLRLWSVNL